MKIGELAKQAKCSVQAIRYYEREALLDPSTRSEGNFRLYGREALQRLRFIRACRGLDMPVSEIKELLDLTASGDAPCVEIGTMLDRRLAQVSDRLLALHHLKDEMTRLRGRCADDGQVDNCEIVSNLSKEM